MRALILLSAFLLVTHSSFAHIIRCRGDIGFWIPDKTQKQKWRQIPMSSGRVFEEHSDQVGAVKIAKDLRYPAAEIFPFYGIEYKITNKDLKIETDHETWFMLRFQNKKLSCDIHNGAGE